VSQCVHSSFCHRLASFSRGSLLWGFALAPLPVGFPQKHQGSAMTNEVPLDNIFFIVVHTTQSRPQHCASAHSPAPLSPEGFYEGGLGCRLIANHQQPRPNWRQLPQSATQTDGDGYFTAGRSPLDALLSTYWSASSWFYQTGTQSPGDENYWLNLYWKNGVSL